MSKNKKPPGAWYNIYNLKKLEVAVLYFVDHSTVSIHSTYLLKLSKPLLHQILRIEILFLTDRLTKVVDYWLENYFTKYLVVCILARSNIGSFADVFLVVRLTLNEYNLYSISHRVKYC